MVKIHYRNSRGGALLQRTVRDIETQSNISVAWNILGPSSSLNNAPKISNLEQLRRFKRENINVPEFTESIEEAVGWIREGLNILGRNKLHSQGRDICSPLNRKWMRKDYWIKYLPNIQEEFRYHIFKGKSIQRAKKVPTVDVSSLIIKNHRKGWVYTRSFPKDTEARNIAKKAVSCLGYDFGAVDIIKANNIYYVLEVNKAPGLDNKTAQNYASAIQRYGDNQ